MDARGSKSIFYFILCLSVHEGDSKFGLHFIALQVSDEGVNKIDFMY